MFHRVEARRALIIRASTQTRRYIAHLGDGTMAVFDTNEETLVGDVKTLSRVHGILAVPEFRQVYASATGSNELAVISDSALQIIARVPAGDYPDGVAYASKANKIYVSDLHGKTDTVIDAKTNQRLATIALGGGAGNTQYDSISEHIFVTVHGKNELAEIDPNNDQVIGNYPLPGCSGSHGLVIDSEHRLACCLRKASESVGIRYGQSVPGGWCPHDLRHTCLTNLALAGVPINGIKEYAGHSSIVETQRYLKFMPESVELAAQASSRLANIAGFQPTSKRGKRSKA